MRKNQLNSCCKEARLAERDREDTAGNATETNRKRKRTP